jgi:toxin-antitoxin system PIN domain toxin
MILPDINLLVFAYNRHAPHHAEAKAWWEALLNGSDPVGMPWAVVCGFVRLMTHPAVLVHPLDPGRAIHHVRSWFERPVVEVLEPGPRHLEIFGRLLDSVGIAANLTTDAHLAAIAIEHQCELHSNDADFARFPGLRWRNPLQSADPRP